MNTKINAIANWYKENNEFAKKDITRLNLLTFINAVLLNINISFTFTNKKLALEINPQASELTQEEINILKLINIALGYKKNITKATPFILMFHELGESFTKNSNELKKYFEDFYNTIKNRNYNLNCRILNFNDYTFFIQFDEKLTNEEIEELKKINDPEQKEFNVYKNDNRLEIW